MSDPTDAEPVASAMRSPAMSTIPRRSRSIRRTSHIDMHTKGAEVELYGFARDLVTTEAGVSTIARASVGAHVGDQGTLTRLTIDAEDRPGHQLLGRSVAGGFRDAVRSAFPDEVDAGSTLALLLDDLPVATLISGYARLYSGDIPADAARTAMKSDICSGWRADGTMMISVRAGSGVPVTVGPIAPSIASDQANDDQGWHDIGPLTEGSMRRRRLIDIHDGGASWVINAMFRDTHRQPGGDETVLHEYTLTATVDIETQTFQTCSAIPRVLPWVECPVAAASADRLVGQQVDDTREYVRRELRGTSTCTHLNDLLRSLGDVGPLARRLTTPA